MANEKRLIDANYPKSIIQEVMKEHATNKLFNEVMGHVCAVLDKTPTVDAVEVVHANWDSNGICTMCGYPIPTDSKYDFIDKDDCLFCYHCGAKMDGGNENG